MLTVNEPVSLDAAIAITQDADWISVLTKVYLKWADAETGRCDFYPVMKNFGLNFCLASRSILCGQDGLESVFFFTCNKFL